MLGQLSGVRSCLIYSGTHPPIASPLFPVAPTAVRLGLEPWYQSSNPSTRVAFGTVTNEPSGKVQWYIFLLLTHLTLLKTLFFSWLFRYHSSLLPYHPGFFSIPFAGLGPILFPCRTLSWTLPPSLWGRHCLVSLPWLMALCHRRAKGFCLFDSVLATLASFPALWLSNGPLIFNLLFSRTMKLPSLVAAWLSKSVSSSLNCHCLSKTFPDPLPCVISTAQPRPLMLFIYLFIFIVQVQLSPFSHHHFPPSHPQSLPALALSVGPSYMFLDDTSPSFPH